MGKKVSHNMKQEQDCPPYGFEIKLRTLGKSVFLVADQKTKEHFKNKGKERIIVITNPAEINIYPGAVKNEIYEWITKINEGIEGNFIEDLFLKDKVEFL